MPSDTAQTKPTQRDRHIQDITNNGRAGWQTSSGYDKQSQVCADPERPRDLAGVRQDKAEAAVVATLFAPYAAERCHLVNLARKLKRDAVTPARPGRR